MSLSIRSSLLTLLIAPVSLQSGAVLASCLAGNPTLEQEYQNAAMVFVGRVTSEEFTPGSKNYLDGTTYTIHVEAVLRGSRSKSVRLFSENTSGRFPMKVGVSYLIFAHKELGRLQADNCGNSGEVSDKTDALTLLHKLQAGIK